MNISEYCGSTEFSIIQFIFQLTDDISEKINKKKLFYKEQVIRYITKQIDSFFQDFKVKQSLVQTYKYEVFNSTLFKLQNILKKQVIFQCS